VHGGAPAAAPAPAARERLVVARRIRKTKRTEHVHIACISAHGYPEDRRKAIDAGCDIHLTKPVDFDELKAVITGFISLR